MSDRILRLIGYTPLERARVCKIIDRLHKCEVVLETGPFDAKQAAWAEYIYNADRSWLRQIRVDRLEAWQRPIYERAKARRESHPFPWDEENG